MKKALAIILSLGMIAAVITGAALANEDGLADGESLPVVPHYISVSGIITSVQELGEESGIIKIDIEDADGSPASLMVSENTVFPFDSEYEEGDAVTGFYLSNVPMVMIWPPQYNISVLVVGEPEDAFVKADRFFESDDFEGDYLYSTDGLFGFRVGEDTEVILANGDDFSDGELAGRRIVVIYDVSTRSIPELATAVKLIVLYEDAVPLPGEPVDITPVVPDARVSVSDLRVLIDGAAINAPEAFIADDGATIMVPLRAIAEALGYKVEWQWTTRSVRLGDTAALSIGNPAYTVNGAQLTLNEAPAPLLRNTFTYVPLQFFTELLA